MDNGACQTPMADHIARAIELMQCGARMRLDAIPGDSSMSSSMFGPDVTAEIAKRLTTPEAKSEVAIKPLVWDEARISDRWPRFTAETILGTYEALQWSSGDFGYTCPNTDRDYPNEEHGGFESLEAAKATAQADYVTRIRSALVDPEADHG